MPTRQSTRFRVTFLRRPLPLMFRYGRVILLPNPNSQLRQFSSSAGIRTVLAPPMVVADAAGSSIASGDASGSWNGSGDAADTRGGISPNSTAAAMNDIVPRIKVERFNVLSSKVSRQWTRIFRFLQFNTPHPEQQGRDFCFHKTFDTMQKIPPIPQTERAGFFHAIRPMPVVTAAARLSWPPAQGWRRGG